MLPPFLMQARWHDFPTAPTVSFATPGDLNIAYTTQLGRFTKIGGTCCIQIAIVTSTFTHTTAAGNLEFSNLPFTVANTTDLSQGTGSFTGITKANYTQFALRPAGNTTKAVIDASGSAQTRSTVTAANTTSGVQLTLVFSAVYRIA